MRLRYWSSRGRVVGECGDSAGDQPSFGKCCLDFSNLAICLPMLRWLALVDIDTAKGIRRSDS
jgi:hypothetical protein